MPISTSLERGLPVKPGDLLEGQYKVLRKLGQGGSSSVFLVSSDSAKKYAAIKISETSLSNSVNDERSVMRHITQKLRQDPDQISHQALITWLHDDFILRQHNSEFICLVMPVLGQAVNALRQPGRISLPYNVLKPIIFQLLVALRFLHKICNVVHTDIKPENILIGFEDHEKVIRDCIEKDGSLFERESGPLPTPIPEDVKDLPIVLVDFELAQTMTGKRSQQIQPVALRAPEVIIGAPWDTSADIWNLGCLLYEFATSRSLGGYGLGYEVSEEDHLSRLIELFGDFPQDLISQGASSSKFFNADGTFRGKENLRMKNYVQWMSMMLPTDIPIEERVLFVDFLQLMLKLRPSDRKTAEELLSHEWFASLILEIEEKLNGSGRATDH